MHRQREDGFESADNHLFDGEVQDAPDFFALRLPAEEGDLWPRRDVSAVIRLLRQQPVVLLGGLSPVKRGFARWCAREFVNDLNHRAPDGQPVEVLELRPTFRARDVLRQLGHRPVPTVFVCPQVEPYQVHREIARLARDLPAHQWVLLTTERSAHAWSQTEEPPPYWFEPQVADAQIAISDWFHRRLDARDQLVAIALALFDGVEEDLAFDGVDALMRGPWRERESARGLVDLGDLGALRSHLAFLPGRTERRIQIRGDDGRFQLLQVAWPTHRRQILAALPLLIEQVRTALAAEGPGSRAGERILITVGRALSDLGRLSVRAVSSSLLALVAEDHEAAHALVASIVVRWRWFGLDEALFELLQSWRTDPSVHAFVHRANARAPSTAIIGRAMAAVVVHAALVDPPNDLHPKLVDLLLAYARSRDHTIVERLLRSEAFGLLFVVHLRQMRELVPELVERLGVEYALHHHLARGVGRGLALAHGYAPQQVKALVEQWLDESANVRPSQVRVGVVPRREAFIGMAVRSLGFIRGFGAPGLTLEAAMHQCGAVLHREAHPFCRQSALVAVGGMARRNLAATGRFLTSVVGNLGADERDTLIELMVYLHCLERSQQPDGDSWVTVHVGSYVFQCPIWYDRAPNETEVSRVVMAFKEMGDQEMASFAFDATREIRRLVEHDEERAQGEEEQRRTEAEAQAALDARTPVPTPVHHRRRLGWDAWLAVELTAWGAQRSAVRGIVAGMLAAEGDPADVLVRWEREGRSRVARAARRAAWLLRYGRWLAAFFVVALGALICAGVIMAAL